MNIKRLLAMALVLCMVLCMVACNNDKDTDEEKLDGTEKIEATEKVTEAETEAAVLFTVKVVDETGAPVPGASIQLCTDLCQLKTTDENGVVGFDMEIINGSKLSVFKCPTGYEYTGEAEVYLEVGSTEYTVELKKVN